MKRTIGEFAWGAVLLAAVGGIVACSSDPMSADRTAVDEPLQPCAFAEPDDLVAMVQNSDLAEALAWPIAFERVDCAGESAVAHTLPDGRTSPTSVLFRYSDGTWRAVAVGPSLDCLAFGVPPVDLPRLGGCRL